MKTKIKNFFTTHPITVNQLILLVSAYFVVVFNEPFYSLAFERITQINTYNSAFMVSVPILLMSLITLFISLFSFKYIIKPFLIILTLLSALVFYATTEYGVVFDYAMMVNVIETDNSEAFAYLNSYAVIFFVIFGVVPAALIASVKLTYHNVLKETLLRFKLIAVSIFTIVIILFFFYENYASFGRNNREIKRYIVPIQFIDSSYKVSRDKFFTKPLTFTLLDKKPRLKNTEKATTVTVLVIGETARAMNFSYNGYKRNTNAYSKGFNPIYFQKVTSCGTATAISVPCLFSAQKRENFDKKKANYQQNLLDIAKLAGVDVLWIDNNSGCKGVCKRVDTIEIPTDKQHPLCDGDYCFDEILIEKLSEKLANIKNKNTLIVLHMIGSHGPTYYRRYPKKLAKFMPDCPKSDIQNCTHEQLINTYDNTIAYTDYVLAKIIALLKSQPKTIQASMLYVSDHGESLGENGAYLHGFPYAFAPAEQTEIPMLFWLTANNKVINQQCLRKKAQQMQYSHDNIFSTVLALSNIKTSAYQTNDDILASCTN
jgi:lipid A ethanolaminephosphotransferase